MDDEAGGDSGAVGAAAGCVEADVVELRTEREVGQNAEVHAATKAIGKLAVGAATTAESEAGASDEALHKWRDMAGITEGKPGTEEIGVGVQGDAAGRGVVATNVGDDTEPPFGVIGDGTADTVLVDSAGTAEAEIRVAAGNVDGLCARRTGK